MKFKKIITDWNSLGIVLDVETVCIILRISDDKLYKLLKKKEIPGNKIGERWMIPRDKLRELIEGTVN